MHVKPIPGRQVPDPEKGGYLPPEGRNVEPTAYWLRRLRDKDVTKEIPKTRNPSNASKPKESRKS